MMSCAEGLCACRWSGDACAQLWGGENMAYVANECVMAATGHDALGMDGTRKGAAHPHPTPLRELRTMKYPASQPYTPSTAAGIPRIRVLGTARCRVPMHDRLGRSAQRHARRSHGEQHLLDAGGSVYARASLCASACTAHVRVCVRVQVQVHARAHLPMRVATNGTCWTQDGAFGFWCGNRTTESHRFSLEELQSHGRCIGSLVQPASSLEADVLDAKARARLSML
jgi:hypothetical protein